MEGWFQVCASTDSSFQGPTRRWGGHTDMITRLQGLSRRWDGCMVITTASDSRLQVSAYANVRYVNLLAYMLTIQVYAGTAFTYC